MNYELFMTPGVFLHRSIGADDGQLQKRKAKKLARDERKTTNLSFATTGQQLYLLVNSEV